MLFPFSSLIKRSKRRCETKSDVKREHATPIANVFAKPLTVLEPKTERTIAAIIVVTFESMIVQNALPNPRFTTS